MSLKQWKIKFKPRIKLNHNIYLLFVKQPHIMVFTHRTYHMVPWRFTILLCGEIGCQRYQSIFRATEEIRDRRIDHLAVDYLPYTFRTVCGFFYVP